LFLLTFAMGAFAGSTCAGEDCLECLAGDSMTGEHMQVFRTARPDLTEGADIGGGTRLQSDDVVLRDSGLGIVVDFRPQAFPALLESLAVPTSWNPRDAHTSWTPIRGSGAARHSATATADRTSMGRTVHLVGSYERSTSTKRWVLTRVQLTAGLPSASCSGPDTPWRSPSSDATGWANASPDVRAALADGWTLQNTLLARPQHPATTSVLVRGHDTVRVLSQGVTDHTVRFSRPELHSEAAARLPRGAAPGYVSAYDRVLIERIDVQLASGPFGAVGAVLVKKGSHDHEVVLDDLRVPDHLTDHSNKLVYDSLQHVHKEDPRWIEHAVEEAYAVLRARPHYDAPWAIVTLGQTSRELAALSRTLSAHLTRAQQLAKTDDCTALALNLADQDAFVVRIAAGFDGIDSKLDDFASERIPTSQSAIDRLAKQMQVMLGELTLASGAFERSPLDSCGTDAVGRTPQ
jgi:hypothetical protein